MAHLGEAVALLGRFGGSGESWLIKGESVVLRERWWLVRKRGGSFRELVAHLEKGDG
jgi:hypothetical protein